MTEQQRGNHACARGKADWVPQSPGGRRAAHAVNAAMTAVAPQRVPAARAAVAVFGPAAAHGLTAHAAEKAGLARIVIIPLRSGQRHERWEGKARDVGVVDAGSHTERVRVRNDVSKQRVAPATPAPLVSGPTLDPLGRALWGAGRRRERPRFQGS